MIVKIKNLSNNELPSYQTEGAAGVDLRANLPDSNITLQPLERTLVPTGLFLEIPEGYEAQVRPRSGMAIKHGITVINSPGTIDCDYRGEVKVPIVNLSNEPFTITHGEPHRPNGICGIRKSLFPNSYRTFQYRKRNRRLWKHRRKLAN